MLGGFMRSKLAVFAMFALLAVFALAACGGPRGGFLYIVASDENVTVSIDDGKPVPFSDLDLPLDLEPMQHKVALTWGLTGETETKHVQVLYKQSQTVEFAIKEQTEVTITSPVPASVKFGGQGLGNTKDGATFKVVPGARDLEWTLDGFGYKESHLYNISGGENINLQPGTDKDHGALYVVAKSKDNAFVTNVDAKAYSSDGSLFMPMLSGGTVVKVTEKATKGVTHYANIRPGAITKVVFGAKDQPVSKTVEVEAPKGSKLTMFLNWDEEGATVAELGDAKGSYTANELLSFAPFAPFGQNPLSALKFIKAVSRVQTSFAQISGEFPQKIVLQKTQQGQEDAKKRPKLMSAQRFSLSSPDGRFYYEGNAIVTAGGWFNSVSDFVPGDWDMEGERVLVTKINRGCNQLEVREAELNSTGPLYYPLYTPKEIQKNEQPGFEVLNAYILKGKDIIGIWGTSKFAHIWRANPDENYFMYQINKPCSETVFFGKRYLVCKTAADKLAPSYIVDITNGKYTKEIVAPQFANDGTIVTGFSKESACAGAIYRLVGDSFAPVWAGVFLP